MPVADDVWTKRPKGRRHQPSRRPIQLTSPNKTDPGTEKAKRNHGPSTESHEPEIAIAICFSESPSSFELRAHPWHFDSIVRAKIEFGLAEKHHRSGSYKAKQRRVHSIKAEPSARPIACAGCKVRHFIPSWTVPVGRPRQQRCMRNQQQSENSANDSLRSCLWLLVG